MKKIIFSLLAFFLLPSFAWAGGKVFLSPGETLSLSPTLFLQEPVTYFWDITGENISSEKQTGKKFSYTFSTSGTYIVVLSATDGYGTTQNSRTEVVVAEDYKKGLPLTPFLFSTPQANEKNEIFLDPQSPKALLYAKESEGNITEYHIDIDISVDSDGDGNPANDRDNKNHQSFFDGSAFPVIYRDTTSAKTAQLTLLSADGDTASETLSFVFTPKDATEPLKAALSSLPPSDARGDIYVFGDTADVIFYAAESEGSILQYRLDTNINIDSNADGKPENDIDNRNHPSFTTGEPFVSSFSRSDGNEQIMQLIAVSPEGKGSLLQRRIIFTQAQSAGFSEERKNEMNPLLLVSASQTIPDQLIDFHVLGAPNDALISWDFDGNGSIDAKGNEMQKQHSYQNEGTYEAEIIVTLGDTSVIRSQTIVVETPSEILPSTEEKDSSVQDPTGDSIPPVSDFSFEQDGSRLLFSSTSQADINVPENTLSYLWDFGNGKTSTEENPQIAFEKAGDYIISLTVTDALGTQTTKEISISLSEEDVLKTFPEGVPSENTLLIEIEKNGSNIFPALFDTSKIDSIEWDFGDGNTSSDFVSDHTYNTAGEYIVRATITDAEGKTTIKEEKIVVTQADISASNSGNIPSDDEGKKQGGFSWLKFLLYFPLILLFLFLIVAILLLLFRKVESPDLQFEEIVHEEVERWRGKMRLVVQDDGTEIAKKTAFSPSPFANVEEKNISSEVIVEEEEKTPEPMVTETSSKVPAWLKNAKTDHPTADTPQENIVQGTSVFVKEKKEEIPEKKSETTVQAEKKETPNPVKPAEEKEQTPAPQKADMPDWLRPSTEEKIEKTPTPKTTPLPASEQKNEALKKEVSTSVVPLERVEEKKPIEKIQSQKNNMPEWLKPEEKKETKNISVDSKSEGVVAQQAVPQQKPVLQPKQSQQPEQKKTDSAVKNMNALQDDEQLPDWLKQTTQQADTKKTVSTNVLPVEKKEPVIPASSEKKEPHDKQTIPPAQEKTVLQQKQVQKEQSQNTSFPSVQHVPSQQLVQESTESKVSQQNISPKFDAPLSSQPKKITPEVKKQIEKPVTKIISSVPAEKSVEILQSVSPLSPSREEKIDSLQNKGISGEIDLSTFPSGDGQITEK